MFKKKNKKDLDKFNPLLKKEVIIIDKNEFEESILKESKEILETLKYDYGIEVPDKFSTIISEEFNMLSKALALASEIKNK